MPPRVLPPRAPLVPAVAPLRVDDVEGAGMRDPRVDVCFGVWNLEAGFAVVGGFSTKETSVVLCGRQYGSPELVGGSSLETVGQGGRLDVV